MMRLKNSNLLKVSAFFGAAGNSAVHVAIPWLVLETTGSSASAGVVLGVSGFSVVFTAPLIGGLIAVLGARKVAISAEVISMLSVLLFPVVGAIIGLNFASLLVIATCGAMFDPAGATARRSMIQRIIDTENLSPIKFNGSFEAASTIGIIIGPAGGALAISQFGTNATFYVIAAAFVLASITASLIRIDNAPDAAPVPVTLSQVLQETKTGASILFHDKPLFAMIGLYALLSVLYMPVETIVLARHFKDLDDPRTLGFILSAMSIGIVIGALQFHRALKMLSPAGLVVWSMTIIGASVCAMALLPGALWFMGIGFVLGLAFGPVSPLGNYLVQQRVPERNHGPVFGVQLSLYHVATPAGSLALGLIIESVSIPWTLVLIGVTFIVVTLGLGLFGPIRRL